MRRSIRISRVFWTKAGAPALLLAGLLVASGCANRAPSLRLLDTRAGYDAGYDDEEVALYQRARAQGASFARSAGPRIAQVYVYPHELPSGDYFWGGYISLLVEREQIRFENPEEEDESRLTGAKLGKPVPRSTAQKKSHLARKSPSGGMR